MTHARFVLGASLVAATAVAPARADTSINFMGHTELALDHTPGDWDDSFRAPMLDVFATQTEAKFAFTGEFVMEAFGENTFEIDVDRLEVAYQATPWLRLRMGRMRTAFGYYGDAYQNGRFFLLPASPPVIYEGDSYDGIVPSHTVGLHADVAKDLGEGNGKLTLDAELLNGRATHLDEVPSYEDPTPQKAVNLRLRYVGSGDLDGLIVGANLYHDDTPDVPAADATAPGVPRLHELIAAGHAVYMAHGIHAVTEAAYFRHRAYDDGQVYTTTALLAEAGYALGDITPYVRYQRMRHSQPDPYFIASDIPSTRLDLFTAGAKYAASASVAFKLEASVDAESHDFDAKFQAAFAF